MAGEIIINGLRQLETKIQRMQMQIERNKDRAAHAAAVMVARAVRKEAPKEARTVAGKFQADRLRKSVRVRRIPGGYRVKPESRVAHLVIKGTQPHVIGVKQAQALYMVIDGGPIFANSANHPGAKANPFVSRAYDLATREEAKVAAGEVLFHDAPSPSDE